MLNVDGTPEQVRATANDVLKAKGNLRVKNFALLNSVMRIPFSCDDIEPVLDVDGNAIPPAWGLEMSVVDLKTKTAIALKDLTRQDIKKHHVNRVINYIYDLGAGKNAKHFFEDMGSSKVEIEATMLDVLQIYYWHYALVEATTILDEKGEVKTAGKGLFCTKDDVATNWLVTTRELDPVTYEVIKKTGEKTAPKTFSLYIRTAGLAGDYDLNIETMSTTELFKLSHEHWSPSHSGESLSPVQKSQSILTKRLEETDSKGKHIPLADDDRASAKKLVQMVISDGRFDKMIVDQLALRWVSGQDSFEKAFSNKTYMVKIAVSAEQQKILDGLAQDEKHDVVNKRKSA